MKSYSYSEARGNFATVLDEAERDGAVEIRGLAQACSATEEAAPSFRVFCERVGTMPPPA
jgi:hypothetical protein